MARTAAAALCVLLAVSGATAQRLSSNVADAPSVTTNAPSLAPQSFLAPTPGPSDSPFSNTGCPTIMQYLNAYSGNFSDLITLINAAPATSNITAMVNSPATSMTLLAPTNTGANASLSAVGSRVAAVARSPALTLRVLQYHLLPTPIPPRDFVNGYSFNTLLNNENGFDTSIAVVASATQGTRLVGARNSANLNNKGIQVCESVVYSIQGLLLPSDLSTT